MIRVAPVPELDATIEIAVADPARARAIEAAITRAATAAALTAAPLAPCIVRLRTRRKLERLGSERIEGKLAIVRVTAASAPRLPDLVDAIRAARPLGVQLVWDGVAPPRARVERHVFAILERARATPSGPPVVLTTTDVPDYAMRILLAVRSRKEPVRS